MTLADNYQDNTLLNHLTSNYCGKGCRNNNLRMAILSIAILIAVVYLLH
jgi:hypothetical protein